MEEGHPQVFADCLAAEAHLLPHRGFAPAAIAPDHDADDAVPSTIALTR